MVNEIKNIKYTILMEAYKNSYWLITKLTSYFGMHSGSD